MISNNLFETITNNLHFRELVSVMFLIAWISTIKQICFGNATKEDREIERKAEIEKELIARLKLDNALLHKLKRVNIFSSVEQEKK